MNSQRFNGFFGALAGSAGELPVVAGAGIFAFRMVRAGGEVALATLAVVLAYLLSSPNVLPWYVLVLPALLCVVAEPFAERVRTVAVGVVAWSVTVTIAYGAPRFWAEGSALGWSARTLEYAPMYAALAFAAFRFRRSNAVTELAV